MQIYLPIAEMPVNMVLVIGLGLSVGFLSGLFGVGGGFLMTPLLIFLGLPPAVTVATQANPLLAASMSGVLSHWKRGNVDIRMGTVMLCGGLVGSVIGVMIYNALRMVGTIDLVISLLYVVLLGVIGTLMLTESLQRLLARGDKAARKPARHTPLHRLPFRMRFPKSRLYTSALLPLGVGMVGGVLVSLMGNGGGFLLIPAMVYIVRMPASLIAGTSLFQIIFTTALTAFLHATTSNTVDLVLAMLLIIGSVAGAQFGSRVSGLLRGEQSRALLGLMIVIVALKLSWGLVVQPEQLYDIVVAS